MYFDSMTNTPSTKDMASQLRFEEFLKNNMYLIDYNSWVTSH